MELEELERMQAESNAFVAIGMFVGMLCGLVFVVLDMIGVIKW